MTTIVTLKSGAYAIYDANGVKILQCNEPINTFNEVVKNIGVDTENVQIIDAETFPDVLGDKYITKSVTEAGQTNLESVIDKVNASISGIHDSEMQTYEDAGVLNGQTDDEAFEEAGIDATQSAKVPVGNVELPDIGDLVYVEGVRGVLRVITGGVGTVSLINADDHNTLIELEEIPGQYFSWDSLRCEQDELKSKYGYKPASMV